MKIVVLGTRGFPRVQGGVETHCQNLYPPLVRQGCQIEVFTRKPYIQEPVDFYEGVKLTPLPCPKNKFLEAIVHTFQGVWKVRRLRPDVLHIHAIGPSLFVPMARLLGLKVVVTNHGPDYKRQKWPWFAKVFLKFCERMGTMFATEVITIADNIAADLRRKYGRDPVIIPNGVALPSPAEPSPALLEKYGLKKGGYVLAVGRLVPEKGLHDLIDAFEKAGLENWKLVIAGGADHEDAYSVSLKDKAAKNPAVVLTGYLTGDILSHLYRGAGLFALPSYYEGLPIVLLEAMSYGLSCIVSDIPAHQNIELAKERFFAAGDATAMADKIRFFAGRPLTETERKEQLDLIARKYDWEKIAVQTLEVYRKVAKNA